MSYTAKQWRAINSYLTKNNLRPELSAFPIIRYTSKDTGELGEIHISNVEDFYTADKEREKRRKAEEKKAERRNPIKGR